MASVGSQNAVRGGTGTTSTPANNIDGNSKRRPSQEGGLFNGLVHQKRNSQDASAEARRRSFAEQKPASGIFGTMWNK
ncbi:MAG: hypothetical protein M1818_002216 [Claussenomyces sp. TS43310]|nr:MAG: hypothetical protein M1818_002216 [Claussenomyces sp. TS43310]